MIAGRLLSLLATSAVVGCAVCCLAAAAPPPGAFSDAVVLAEPNVSTDDDVGVAMTWKGDALAAWVEVDEDDNARVFAATHPAGHAWRPARPLSAMAFAPRREFRMFHPVAAAAGTRFVVAWLRPISNTSGEAVGALAETALVRPNGAQTAVRALAPTLRSYESVDVAANRRGAAVAAWCVTTKDGPQVEVAFMTTAGAWKPARRLGPGCEPSVALDDAGRALVASVDRRARGGVVVDQVASGGLLARRQLFPSPPFRRFDFHVSVAGAPSGWAAVVWGEKKTWAAVRAPRKAFGSASVVPGVEYGAFLPDGVGIDNTGNLTVVGEVGYRLHAATRLPSGRWSGPTWISRGTLNALVARLAVNPAGDAIVAWGDGGANPNVGKHVARAAVRPRGGAWSDQQVLSADFYPGGVAIDRAGNGIAAFASGTLWVAEYRAAG